ncbi:MAG TPA: MAPEG family protein [Woeseiaceae bacterium]|jgi:hypothetical protein|nr:MAPEG family protein [Woeseiaceae bacterium]
MNSAAILQPMLGVMVLTAIVWFVMYARRIPAMQRARKPVQEYTTPDKVVELLPEVVNNPANNLRNLFELPVMFYALCLYLYVTGTAQQPDVIAAWVFLVFRVFHSAIQCTVNVVMLRFTTYCIAAFALWFLLARAVFGVFS